MTIEHDWNGHFKPEIAMGHNPSVQGWTSKSLLKRLPCGCLGWCWLVEVVQWVDLLRWFLGDVDVLFFLKGDETYWNVFYLRCGLIGRMVVIQVIFGGMYLFLRWCELFGIILGWCGLIEVIFGEMCGWFFGWCGLIEGFLWWCWLIKMVFGAVLLRWFLGWCGLLLLVSALSKNHWQSRTLKWSLETPIHKPHGKQILPRFLIFLCRMV